jgi:hypothetical protein
MFYKKAPESKETASNCPLLPAVRCNLHGLLNYVSWSTLDPYRGRVHCKASIPCAYPLFRTLADFLILYRTRNQGMVRNSSFFSTNDLQLGSLKFQPRHFVHLLICALEIKTWCVNLVFPL